MIRSLVYPCAHRTHSHAHFNIPCVYITMLHIFVHYTCVQDECWYLTYISIWHKLIGTNECQHGISYPTYILYVYLH